MNVREQMKLFHDNYVVAWHEHFTGDGFGWHEPFDAAMSDRGVAIMDLYGINKVMTSFPFVDPYCTPEMFTDANNRTYAAMKRHPSRIGGQAFVNPLFFRETLKEVERCADLGFAGIKLLHQCPMDSPAMFPMIEKCIELDLHIMIHSAKCTDVNTNIIQPRLSNGVHMANAARRYPEAAFIMAHIGGGGDWKWSVKAIKNTPNVMADIGGSVHDRPMIEESVKLLGADRLLFATDWGWSSSLAKVLGADISEEDKKTILAGKRFARFAERTAR